MKPKRQSRHLICPVCLDKLESYTQTLCRGARCNRAVLVVTTTPEGLALMARRKKRGMSRNSADRTVRAAGRKPIRADRLDFDTATPGRL